MYSAAVETGEDENPYLPRTFVSTGGFPILDVEVSENVDTAFIKWWRPKETF